MRRYKYYLVQLLFCGLVLTGCDKYLDVKPKGKQLLTTVSDYDQWLNDDLLIYGPGLPYGSLDILTDNMDFVTVATPATKPEELIYTWALQFSTVLNVAPIFWGEHYARINQYNTALIGIDDALGGSLNQKKALKAEALLGRALEYFYLVNEYGQPYDSATASKDLGVPFVTSNDVSQTVPGRSSVQENYQHIINDLNNAIPDLPDDNSSNRLRGSKAAGYSVLARVYFYARNYQEARKNAELALTSGQAIMLDFNGTLPSTNLLSIRQDAIYGRMVLGYLPASLDLMRSFATNDLRVKKLYQNLDGYSFTVRGATSFVPAMVTPVLQYSNTGTSIQEMKLIIAEAAARSGDLTTALQQLDDIRKNRYAKDSYVRFDSNNQETVLQEILMERNHELAFNCLRWFDMRRLDKENRMGTVTRYDATGKVITTLQPHSNRYTLQIPIQVLSFNPGMQQNP